MEKRHVSILSIAGVLCVLLSVPGGGPQTGYSVIGVSAILFRAGMIYLTLGVVTYFLSSVTPRDAVLGALLASGVVFVSGLIGMYSDLVLTPPEYGTSPTGRQLIGTQVQGVCATLPISAGYVTGVLVRTENHEKAVLVLLGAMLGGGFVGSQVALASGSAPGFTEMVFGVTVVATAGLALLPVAVMAGWMGSAD